MCRSQNLLCPFLEPCRRLCEIKLFKRFLVRTLGNMSLLLLSLVELKDFECDFNNCFGLLYMCCMLPGKLNGQCQFCCGILKIVGPK